MPDELGQLTVGEGSLSSSSDDPNAQLSLGTALPG